MKITIRIIFLFCISTYVYAENINDQGLYPIWVNKECGYINKLGEIIIKPQFIDCGEFKKNINYAPIRNLYPQEDLSKIDKNIIFNNYISRKGELLFNSDLNQIENINEFKNGYSLFKKSGKYGIISAKGKIAFEPKYFSLTEVFNGYIDGLQVVYKETERSNNVISDIKGKTLFSTKNYIYPFNNGVAIYSSTDMESWGVIDRKGEPIIDEEFARLDDKIYSNNRDIVNKTGLIVVFSKETVLVNPKISRKKITFSKEQLCGVVNTTGKTILPVKYSNCIFNSNYILATELEENVIKGNVFYIRKNYIFSHYGEKILLIDEEKFVSKDKKDKKNKKEDSIEYSSYFTNNAYFYCSDELIPFSTEKNGKIGYITSDYKDILIQPNFDRADCFSNGLAYVEFNNTKAFIDKTGNIKFYLNKLPINYVMEDFDYNGIAKIKKSSTYNDYYYINSNGEIIWENKISSTKK